MLIQGNHNFQLQIQTTLNMSALQAIVPMRKQSYKINSVLKNIKPFLSSLAVSYFNLDHENEVDYMCPS